MGEEREKTWEKRERKKHGRIENSDIYRENLIQIWMNNQSVHLEFSPCHHLDSRHNECNVCLFVVILFSLVHSFCFGSFFVHSIRSMITLIL